MSSTRHVSLIPIHHLHPLCLVSALLSTGYGPRRNALEDFSRQLRLFSQLLFSRNQLRPTLRASYRTCRLYPFPSVLSDPSLAVSTCRSPIEIQVIITMIIYNCFLFPTSLANVIVSIIGQLRACQSTEKCLRLGLPSR